MKKTLVLVFIHGFKGGDNTFRDFPNHLAALCSHSLPKVNVLSLVYPKFETRGDLHETVDKFKEWLSNKVIDLEVAANTPSPTVNPSVRVILVGHSMGGIVAAETLLSISRDLPISANKTSSTPPPEFPSNNGTTTTSESTRSTNLRPPTADAAARSSSAPPPESRTNPIHDDEPHDSPLFPAIQAVLAFDTPYLGIHPGVVAHGAEEHYNTAAAAYQAYATAQKIFGSSASGTATPNPSASAGALPPPNGSGWGKWGRYAMMAAGAGAVAAAGAGVWMKKEQISEGWAWAFSHLEFVGCLARGAELTQRVEKVVAMETSHGVGFAILYTNLGNDKIGQTKYSAQFLGEQRTFCVVPEKGSKKGLKEVLRSDSPSPGKRRKISTAESNKKKTGERGAWVRCTNAKATSETGAHVHMFTPAENPDYFAMGERARGFVERWVDREWYEDSGKEEAGQAEAHEEAKKESAEEELESEMKAREEEAEVGIDAEGDVDMDQDIDSGSGAERGRSPAAVESGRSDVEKDELPQILIS